MVIFPLLKRLVGPLVRGLRARFLQWSKPLIASLPLANPRRPWQKQVRAHGGKRPLTTTTHHPQTAGETASMHENRSCPSRPAGQDGSNLAAGPVDCSTRYPAALASRALPPVLEAQVKGSCSQAKGSPRNHRLDQRDGEGESALGCERICGELLKLGIHVCKRTIQKYMRTVRTPPTTRSDSGRPFCALTPHRSGRVTSYR